MALSVSSDEDGMQHTMQHNDYQRIAIAIENIRRQPDISLAELASSAEMSDSHFQRLFSRWVGVSAKRFAQYIKRQNLQCVLQESRDLLSLSLASGLSGPGRLHDLVVTCDAVTPAQLRSGGAGLSIQYGFSETPFGRALVAMTERGICHLAFVSSNDKQELGVLIKRWPEAKLDYQPETAKQLLGRLFSRHTVSHNAAPQPLHLYLRGSNFQLQVWQALLRIPEGKLVTYADIATLVDSPKAARAVGSAVAANSVAYLIPCHRVIRATGESGEYRWGSDRKVAMIGWEGSQALRQ